MHVGHTIASNEIDVDIENVSTFFFLRFCKRDQPVPILGIEQIAHLLRARCIYSLTNDQKRSILRVRLLKIDRRSGRRQLGPALFWRNSAQTFDHLLQMFRRCAAASADDIRPKIIRKMLNLCRKALRRFVVMLFAILDLRQAGVWQHRYRNR